MREFSLVINEHDIAILSEALVQLPYAKVARLIADLNAQIQQQQANPEETPAQSGSAAPSPTI